MTHLKRTPIPPPQQEPFIGAINHPKLWLWNCWTSESFETISLYCMALNRFDSDNAPIDPSKRDQYVHHIRLFTSSDDGDSWIDQGSVLSPNSQFDESDANNLGSGSVNENGDTILMAYTGFSEVNENGDFLQSICLTHSISRRPNFVVSQEALSNPFRDYKDILVSSYYSSSQIGLAKGEEEIAKQISSWKDPFLFEEENGLLYVFWSVKIGKDTPGIASAVIETSVDGLKLGKLLPPIQLPVSKTNKQFELPKIYRDRRGEMYYCMVSVCNESTNGHRNSNSSKEIHLYRSKELQGTWEPYDGRNAVLNDFPNLYGGCLVSIDFDTGFGRMIAPYSENAGTDLQFSIPKIEPIKIIHT